jgi:polyphosphate glucokinase
MNILVIDVGGTNVKYLMTGQTEPKKFPSGPDLTPQQLVQGVLDGSRGWSYEVVSIGLPTPIAHDKILEEPVNLGPGWLGFDFAAAFKKPVKLINDAAMQALGSYQGGKMLFLGLGTGLGAAIVAENLILPLELAHLPYRKGMSYEDYLGLRGVESLGKKRWRLMVEDITVRLRKALQVDYVVIGGGNSKKLNRLPPGARLGSNQNAFVGGFRMWDNASGPSNKPSAGNGATAAAGTASTSR